MGYAAWKPSQLAWPMPSSIEARMTPVPGPTRTPVLHLGSVAFPSLTCHLPGTSPWNQAVGVL